MKKMGLLDARMTSEAPYPVQAKNPKNTERKIMLLRNIIQKTPFVKDPPRIRVDYFNNAGVSRPNIEEGTCHVRRV